MVIITLTHSYRKRNMAWKNLSGKGKRPQIRLSQSQTPTSWSPACCFGKRDACCLTKSSLFGFGVGAMLAGMLTGGWMWNVLSPSLTLLSSRRWMTCCTKSFRKSWVVGSYSFLTTHWFDCLEWITLYFSFPGNEESEGTEEWWRCALLWYENE